MPGLTRHCPPGSAPVGVILLAALTAAPGASQGLLGRVVDADADTAVVGAAVTLVDSAGTALVTASTDTAGAFGLPVYTPGTYTLRVRHVAYREAETRPLEVGRGDVLHLDIRVSRLAFDLDPLTVTVRQRAPTSYLNEYYDRLDRREKSGWGVILTREELEPLAGYSVEDLLRRSTLVGRFQRLGRACTPAFYWNRSPVPVGDIPVSNVEGIEIYRRGEVPIEYGGYHPCGVVLVWNRPVRPGEGSPPGWRRFALAAGLTLLILVVR